MAITVPQPGQQVSAELFGIPVANQLNTWIPTTWTTVPLSAGVISTPNNQAFQYRKFGDIVQVRGVITINAGVGAGSTVAVGTMPSGFRPPVALIFPAMCGWTAEGACRMDFTPAGQINVKPTIVLNPTDNYVSVGMAQFSTTS